MAKKTTRKTATKTAKKTAKKTARKAASKTTRSTAKKSASPRGSAKRELIATGTDKRYVKRRSDGTFKESDNVGRSLAADTRRASKKTVKPGFGDQGDQPRRSVKKAAKKR
jgi:hypothetical protein